MNIGCSVVPQSGAAGRWSSGAASDGPSSSACDVPPLFTKGRWSLFSMSRVGRYERGGISVLCVGSGPAQRTRFALRPARHGWGPACMQNLRRFSSEIFDATNVSLSKHARLSYCARLLNGTRESPRVVQPRATSARGELDSCFLRACNADAAEESDCATRNRPDRTEIRSDDLTAPVATPAVAVAASAVAVAAPAVAVAAPAVTAVSTSCATGTLFSALPAHYGERAKHSFRSGDGREARPHNWW